MHQRIKLVSILVLLVVALLVAVWLTAIANHSPIVEQYYLQIWLPIVLAGALGAMAMHVSHIWRSTSTSKVDIELKPQSNGSTEPVDIKAEIAESKDKKIILATEDVLI